MATPSKRPDPPTGAAIAPAALKHALNALTDPKVQDQIRQHAGPILDAVRRWGPSVITRVEHLGDRFGQTGLERRAANLQELVAGLSSDAPDLAALLRPVTKSLDDVSRMLKVSGNLPFAKRKKAHMKIDDVLDDLEAALFSATLPNTPPDRET